MPPIRRSPDLLLLIGTMIFLLLPGVANAHAMRIQCQESGGSIEVRVGYGRTGATPASAARVRLLDSGNVVIAEGHTNSAGEFRMPTPPAGEYTIEVEDEDHTGSIRLAISPSTVSVERPPLWPALAALAVVLAIIGYWKYRVNRPGSPSTHLPPASEPS